MLEASLAYLHLTAILTMVVFLSAEAALCRSEWINAAVIRRLVRVDLVYGIATVLVLLTGLARLVWGAKGWGWYWHNPLLHAKLALFVLMGALSVKSTLTLLHWRRALALDADFLPLPAQVRKTRRRIMLAAHLMLVMPLLAVLLARGWGS